MNYEFKQAGKFRYVETGTKDAAVLLLLHGLFGGMSNFDYLLEHFGEKYNVVAPILPIFDLPREEVSLDSYRNYIHEFVTYKGYEKVNVMGNSLGGHIALLFTLEYPELTQSTTLTGSSGLFEKGMGETYPRRGDYDYIKTKTEYTFYDPKTATKALVDEVFDMVNDREKVIRIILTSKSAIRHNLEDKLHLIENPVLLIWGNNDNITPPFVGEKFHEHLKNSELHFIDKCGHAPMMEQPTQFNALFEVFLERVTK